MNKPFEEIAHFNWVRADCVEQARKLNRYNKDVNKLIADAKEIERYVCNVQPAVVIDIVKDKDNGR